LEGCRQYCESCCGLTGWKIVVDIFDDDNGMFKVVVEVAV